MPEIIHQQTFSSVEAAAKTIKQEHPGVYNEPWWGDKDTQNIKNRGYVIGWKDVASKSRWRLDYDPGKKLHINWVQDQQGGEQRKVCYRINTVKKEETMFDYFIDWTKNNYQKIPTDIKARLDRDSVKKWYNHFWA